MNGLVKVLVPITWCVGLCCGTYLISLDKVWPGISIAFIGMFASTKSSKDNTEDTGDED